MKRGTYSKNNTLKEAVITHWTRNTDYMIARMFEGVSVARIRGIRRVLGLRRDKEHLQAMYASHRKGKVHIGRYEDKSARQLSAMQIANRKVKGLL